MRWATSSFRPSRGEMTVTLASALRTLRMRPAATWELSVWCWTFAFSLIFEWEYVHLAATDYKDSFVSNLPGKYE